MKDNTNTVIDDITESTFNETDARIFYRFLGHRPDEYTELRIIKWLPEGGGQVKQEFVQSEEEFIRVLKNWNGKRQCYAGLNPRKTKGGKMEHVARVTAILFDVDSDHPKNQPASDDELLKAEHRMKSLKEWIRLCGYSQPLVAMSGNGFHVIHKVNIEIDDDTQSQLERYHHEAADDLDSMFDIPRIVKVPGTLSIKGVSSEERPHRLSYIVDKGSETADTALGRHIRSIEVDKTDPLPVVNAEQESKMTDTFENERGQTLAYLRRQDNRLDKLLTTEVPTGYPSASEADMATLSMLLTRGYNDNESVTILRCFRGREKLDRQDYISKMLEKIHSEDTGEKTSEKAAKKIEPSRSERIVQMVRDERRHVLLFASPPTETYAQIPRGDHTEILRIHGRAFKEYLTYQYHMMTKKVPNSSALRDAINTLSSLATHAGIRYTLHNRVAWHDNAIWYDLTNEKWQVVRIDENGWDILPGTPIPLFRRFDHQRPQVLPIRDNRRIRTRLWPLMKFHNHANVRNRILDQVSQVFNLVPGVPHPPSIVSGPAGCGKTLGFHRTIKLLIDPSSVDQGLSLPRKSGDFPIQLERHYYLIYSNLSKLEPWQSDVFCRAIDGAADETRKLYTDAEVQAFQYLRCIGINAIPVVATRADLLDRSLLFPLASIPREKRLDEEELFASFEQLRPIMLGALFDALSAAMKIRPTVQLGYIERMGAFTKWGYAIAQALDYNPERFLRNYASNRQTANEEIVNSHILSNVVMEFMRDRSEWMGAPRTLLTDLTEFEFGNKTPHKDWPKDATRMSKEFERLAQPLDRSGLKYTRGRLHDGRWISLAWHERYGPRTVQKSLETEEKPDNGSSDAEEKACRCDASDATVYISDCDENKADTRREDVATPATQRHGVMENNKSNIIATPATRNIEPLTKKEAQYLRNHIAGSGFEPAVDDMDTVGGLVAKGCLSDEEKTGTYQITELGEAALRGGATE